MTIAGDAQQRVEAYLGTLRQLLRGMNAEDAREIVEEMRSHLMDRVAASGEATNAGLTRHWPRWAVRKSWPKST